MKLRMAVVLPVLVLALALSALAADITGQWTATFNTQVGEQHCRLDVVDVSALDGARHNPRARISTYIGGKKFTIDPPARRHFENWGKGRH